MQTGRAYLDLGKREEALSHLQRAVEQGENDWQTHYYLALALHQDGQKEKTAAELRRAIELYPELKERADVQGMLAEVEAEKEE
jgi:Flp pilus assembly protein TadD